MSYNPNVASYPGKATKTRNAHFAFRVIFLDIPGFCPELF